MATITGHTAGVRCLAFSPDGKTIATVATDGDDDTLGLWVAATGRERAILRPGRAGIDAVAFSPDGKTLATGQGGDRGAGVWDLTTRKRRTPEQEHYQEIVSEVTFSPDGKLVAIASWCTGRLEVWDVARGRRTAVLRKPEQQGAGPHTVAFAAGGREVVAWGTGDGFERWDVTGRKLKATVDAGQKPYRAALTPDGKLLVTGENGRGEDEFKLRVWDVATGKERSTFTGRGSLVVISVSRDGRVVAAACVGGEVGVWDVATGKERLRLGLPAREGWVLGLSPDGAVLATGSFEEKAVRLWAVPAGK